MWANTVTIGAEMGDLGRGLKRAAGVTGDELDLSQKLAVTGDSSWAVFV